MCRLLLILLAVAVVSQSAWSQEDEQYAADANNLESDIDTPADEPDDVPIEGSGAQGLQEAALEVPLIDEPDSTTTEAGTDADEAISCPADLCICNWESEIDAVKLTVDCSSKGLKELPPGIDYRVNKLLLQNNQLQELPKSISEFKDLEELNVNNNSITQFSYGSVSELPKLRELKAANNRLLEFPHEIKNGLDLRNLELLDLGGNDMREALTADNFAHLERISLLTIPVSTPELIADICHRLSGTLQQVCTNNCDLESEDCSTLSEPSLDTIPVPASEPTSEKKEASEAASVVSMIDGASTPDNDGDPQLDPSVSDTPEKPKQESDTRVETDDGVNLTAAVSTDVTSANPIDAIETVRNDVSPLISSDGTSDIPSDVSSINPSDITSAIPSDISSLISSDVTSAIPSDVTSAIPSDVTSAIPSDVFSAIPSDVTSAIPSDISSPISRDVTSDSVTISTTTEFSLRDAVNNEKAVLNSGVAMRSGLVSVETADTSVQPESNADNKDISSTDIVNGDNGDAEKVGATVSKQAGGIDSSVIAIIVAGMVVVVAGVTIKKNWSSIRNRFRPRPAPGPVSVEAGEVQPNGTTPEEVPLQSKTPA